MKTERFNELYEKLSPDKQQMVTLLLKTVMSFGELIADKKKGE